MRIPDKLIKVSKNINEKLFDLDVSKLSRKELKKVSHLLPSDEERQFMEIWRSNNPQLMRIQRKMSICFLFEVTEMEEDQISFLFGRDTFTVKDPENAFRISQILERGTISDALCELALQKCILRNGEPVGDLKTGSLKLDELRAVQLVADRFFFQPFLT